MIGIEPEWTDRVVQGIAKTGKPVKGFSIERNGDINTIAMASRQAKEYVQWATEIQKTECSWMNFISRSNAASPTPHRGLLRTRPSATSLTRLSRWARPSPSVRPLRSPVLKWFASSVPAPEVGEKFMRTWNEYNNFILKEKTDDLSSSQPTKGNIRGGLTTIEEKAFGNLQKIGKKASYVGVLKPAEVPKGKGLWFMDTSSAAAEAVTLWAASGAVVHLSRRGRAILSATRSSR